MDQNDHCQQQKDLHDFADSCSQQSERLLVLLRRLNFNVKVCSVGFFIKLHVLGRGLRFSLQQEVHLKCWTRHTLLTLQLHSENKCLTCELIIRLFIIREENRESVCFWCNRTARTNASLPGASAVTRQGWTAQVSRAACLPATTVFERSCCDTNREQSFQSPTSVTYKNVSLKCN